MSPKESQNNKFIIDSYGWIEYFSNGKRAEKYSKYIENCNPKTYFIPSIIIYEVYKKITSSYTEEDAIFAIAHIKNCTTIIDIDTEVAIKGAEVSIDQKLPMADAIIWGIADQINLRIITSDSHFRDKENVIFIE